MEKNLYVWTLAIFAAFGGFMFGYDTGVINGVKDMDGFRQTFNLSHGNESCSGDVQEGTVLGLIVSTFSLGCFIGALAAGAISDVIGRKPTIMIGGVVFTIGGAVQSASFFIWMIFLGRIVAGVGVGILSMVVPVYNAELAPSSLRGRLVSLNQLAITAGLMYLLTPVFVTCSTTANDKCWGQKACTASDKCWGQKAWVRSYLVEVSFIADLVCERFVVGWRVALGVQCLFGIILITGMLLLPETPRWLVKKHKDQKAVRVLMRLRRTDMEGVQEELREIQATVTEDQKGNLRQMWQALISWKILQRIGIGMILQLLQQFTGMNVIMYYSTSIFCNVGVQQTYISTAIVGTINFLTTILSIFLVDKVGRKALLLSGALGMLFSMATAATLILVFQVEEGGSTAVGYIVVALICFFVFNFAYGWGPVAWVVTSEIFPLNIRGIAVSLTTAANWTGNFVLAITTPVLMASPLQTYGTFYIYSFFLATAFLFVLITLPETKGESLERIEELFSKPWLERINIVYYLRCGCPWWGRRRDYQVSDLSDAKTDDILDDKTKLLGDSQVTDESNTSM